MKSRKKDCSFNVRKPVVQLERLPNWISKEKSVKVLVNSREFLLTSLPSSHIWNDYRSLKIFCGNYNSELPTQDMTDVKRLTCSVGQTTRVDIKTNMPDDINGQCKSLHSWRHPFLGFKSYRDGINLSNNKAYQFLSKVEDNMDFVLKMVISDLNCSEEGHKGRALLGNQLTSNISRSNIVKYNKPINKNKGKRCNVSSKGSTDQVAFESIKDDHCSAVNVPVNRKMARCGKKFCRLGCMCDSLKSKAKHLQCGHAECMFSKRHIQPNSTRNDSDRLNHLYEAANSPQDKGIMAKRQRRSPKRYVEEVKKLNLTTIKKSKLHVHSSKSKYKGSARFNKCTSIKDLPDAIEKYSEQDSMDFPCSHNGSNIQSKVRLSVARKSTSGWLMHKVSILKNTETGESPKTNQSLKRSHFHGNSSGDSGPSPKIALLNDSYERDTPSDYSVLSTTLQKYFRSFMEYRQTVTSSDVNEHHLVSMCSQILRPLRIDSIILMKWEILEEKVRKKSAHLWLSQVPKHVAKMYVSEREIPPDSESLNFKDVENICGIPSSIDYLFQFYKYHPKCFRCFILVCRGLYWEMKGILNMKDKASREIRFKVVRSCAKGMKELTFANSGKKILITHALRSKFNMDAQVNSHIADEVVASDINEIAEPDHQLYDPTSCCLLKNSNKAHPEKNNVLADTCESADLHNPLQNSALDNPLDDSARVQPFVDSTLTNPVSMYPSHTPLDFAFPKVPYHEELLTCGMQSTSSIMTVPQQRALEELSWYCLNLDKTFDIIIIDKLNFSVTYKQIVNALEISREKNAAMGIAFPWGDNYLIDNQIWGQGVYVDYTLSDNVVKVGPYYNLEVPIIMAFVNVNGAHCGTCMQISREPFLPKTMPRVLKNGMIAGDLEEQSSSVELKMEVEERDEKKVVASCIEDMSPTESETVEQGITSSSASIALRTVKCDPCEKERELECSKPSDTSTPETSIVIVSVEGNWSGFGDVVNPTSDNLNNTGNMSVATESIDSSGDHVMNPSSEMLMDTKGEVAADTKYEDSTISQVCQVKSGLLVSDIPTLSAIVAIKGCKRTIDSECIRLVDPSWNVMGNPLIFKTEEAACDYLNSIIKVKLFPDDYRVKWTFVEDEIYVEMTGGKGLHDIRKLSEDQFITPRGLFSYDDVCTDNLSQYGLETKVIRKLLREIYRRRAKQEKHSFLPEAKTDIQSLPLIHSSGGKGKMPLEPLTAEIERKGTPSSKLRTLCRGKGRATSSKTTRKQPTLDAPAPPVTELRSAVEKTQGSIKVLEAVEAPASPEEDLHGPQRGHDTGVSFTKPVRDMSEARSLFYELSLPAATNRSLMKCNHILNIDNMHNSTWNNCTFIPKESKTPESGMDHQMSPIPSIFQEVSSATIEETNKDITEEITNTAENCGDLDQSTLVGTSSDTIKLEYEVCEPDLEESSQCEQLATDEMTFEENSFENSELCNIFKEESKEFLCF